MNVSFDGARRRLADQFNAMARTELTQEQHKAMVEMRETVWAFLCMYDPAVEDDCNDLSGEIGLDDVPDPVEDDEGGVGDGQQA